MSDSDKVLRRVLVVSGMNGWSVIVLGGLCTLAALLFFNLLGLVIGLAVTASGYMEIKGRSALKNDLSEAGKLLASSQIWLLCVIVVYAGYQLLSFDLSKMLQYLPAEIYQALFNNLGLDKHAIGQMITRIYYSLYISVILGSFLYQGSLWFFYKRSVLKLTRASIA